MITQSKAEARGWVFDPNGVPKRATLGAPPQVVRTGSTDAELLESIESWEAEQMSRKPHARHPYFPKES